MMLCALILGLSAWGLAVLFIQRSIQGKGAPFLLPFSAVMCTLSLMCALYQVKHWVSQEDIAAIIDCINGLLFGGITLTAVEAILLVAGAFVGRE